MGGLINPEDGKFNFKIKIVQTDLASREYLFGAGIGDGFGLMGDPTVYQNSSYISKLFLINNYSGGILAKEKIEDMPERYRRFIQLNKPTEAEIIKNFTDEMIMLANREEIGQNVFYSGLSDSYFSSSGYAASSHSAQSNRENQSAAEYTELSPVNFEDFGDFAGFADIADYFDFGKDDWIDDEDEDEDEDEYENENGEYGEGGENENAEFELFENFRDDEEIKDILLLNNIFNSEMYKMSKVEYDFNISGNISMTDDGSINITYNESEMTGISDSYIQFLFNANNRDIVTVRRKYLLDTWFTLEKGRRISVERRGRDYGAVLTTNTQELVNNMTIDGGNMRLVYTTETNGVPTEAVLYSIYAEPAGKQLTINN